MPKARPTRTPPKNCLGNLMVDVPCGGESCRFIERMIPAAPRRRQNPMTCGQPAAGKPPTLTTGLSQPPSKHGLEPKMFHNIEECLVRKNDSGCDTGHLQPAPVGSTDASGKSLRG